MSIASRWILGFWVVGAIAVTLACFRIVPPALPPPPPRASENLLSPEDVERRAKKLESYRAKLFRSMAVKRHVAEELINGRTTLIEAAARFQRAEEGLPALAQRLRVLRRLFSGKSDAERWCRRVIQYIKDMEPEKVQAGRAARQLEQELDQHLRRYGTVHLPVPPPE
jgi:hypothetical protein